MVNDKMMKGVNGYSDRNRFEKLGFIISQEGRIRGDQIETFK